MNNIIKCVQKYLKVNTIVQTLLNPNLQLI